MRHALTGLGILLCLALAALMAGPHFVDWNAWRPQFEQRLTEAFGAPVRIEGPLQVTLLPTPSVTLEQVRIGAADGRGLAPFEAERISVALAATSLLRGDFHVTEALLEGPVLRIAEGAAAPAAPAGAEGVRHDVVSIEKLAVKDGSIVIDRSDRQALTFSALSLEAEVTSLAGPAKGAGSFVIGDDPRSFRFALGRIEGGKARLKALVEDFQAAVRIDADGLAGFENGKPVFDGAVNFSGNPKLTDEEKAQQLAMRGGAKVRFAERRATLDDITLTFGAEPSPFSLAGAGTLEFTGRPRFDVTLSARSFDFDRQGPEGKAAPVAPVELLRQAAALLPEGESPDAPDGSLDLSVGGIIIGGQTIVGARLGLARSGEGFAIQRFEGEFPGQTRIRFERSQGAPAGLLSGPLEVESRDPERFVAWYSGAGGSVTSALSIKANAMLSPLRDGVAMNAVTIERGGTRLSGQGAYFMPSPGQRPAARLALKLASSALNIADIPSFEAQREKNDEPVAFDFDLDLEAARLVYEGVETGRLVAKLRRDGQILSIDRVAITEFGGASLIASGAIGGGARRVTAKLDATRVEALAALGERLLPGALMEGVRKRAGLIAPALLVATFDNEDADESYVIGAEGRLANTNVKVSGKLAGRRDLALDLTLGLENPEAGALAAQIGGRPAANAGGPGKVELSVRGNPRGSMSTLVTGAMPGIEARVTGNIRVFQPFAPFEGDMVIRAADLAPAATSFGFVTPALPKGTQGKAEGRVVSNLQRITIERLKAEVAGQTFSGEIAFAIDEGGKVSGQIRTPLVDFRPIASLATGAMRPGGGSASAAFGPALGPPLPGDLWVEAEKARIDDTTVLEDAKFVLRFDHGAASVEYAHARLGQARLEGEVALRRVGATAFLSTKIKAIGARFEQFAAGAARGQVDIEAQMSGQGDSPARLVAALAGGGQAFVRAKTAPRFDPSGLQRLLAVPLDAIGPLDASNLGRRLEAELDKGAWSPADARHSLVIINGVARTGVAAFETPQARYETSATLDLSSLTLDYRVTTTASTAPPDWRGAAPQFTVNWRGPLAAPQRSVAVDSLVNGYIALALVRDLARTEIFDQDVRERAAHNRRLKAEQARRKADEDMRRAEETARLQAIERRRQEEAERLRLEREAEEERVRRERAAEEERLRRERAAEEERQRQARLQLETERRAAEETAEQERQRAAAALRDEEALRERIERVLREREVPTATLPPPLTLNPPAAGRPRVAAPVDVRPLPPPQTPQ